MVYMYNGFIIFYREGYYSKQQLGEMLTMGPQKQPARDGQTAQEIPETQQAPIYLEFPLEEVGYVS